MAATEQSADGKLKVKLCTAIDPGDAHTPQMIMGRAKVTCTYQTLLWSLASCYMSPRHIHSLTEAAV